MQLKKLLQGTVFAAVAAACIVAVPDIAKAAEATGALTDAGISEVKVNGTTGQLTAKASSAKEILVGFGKIKKDTITVASWDTYNAGSNGITVDLSKLNNTKDNYIVLSTPGKDVSIIKIPAVDKAIKASYDVVEGKLSVGTAKTGKATPAPLTNGTDGTAKNYEYRTAYSNWTSLADNSNNAIDLTFYQEQGAALFVRAKGGAETAVSKQESSEAYTYGTTKAQVYVAVSLPGKETKVSIAAKAKGPKITADYVNGTIKFPKNSEYRLATTSALQDADANGKYIASPSEAKSIADVIKGAGSSFSSTTEADLEVRTLASGKKGPSKWSRLAIATPVALKATDELVAGKEEKSSVPEATTSEQKVGGKGVALAEVKEGGTNKFTFKYVKKGKISDTKQQDNALEIENKGDFDYEIVVGAKGATAAPAEKATKIAAGKKVVIQKDDLSVIFIRKAGNKKKQTWVGEYAKLGVIDYNYTIPAKAN